MKILAFESSCDDTSVALLSADKGAVLPRLESMAIQSQWDVHERYGGVVPELASRAHLQNLIPCIEKVLSESGTRLSEIDVFTATNQPGLIGCLLIGHTAAKTLSLLYEKPLISCHHIESHLMSVYLDCSPEFPYLSLVVSGGHTSLYLVKSWDEFEVLGYAIDDAAGEAFDKGAKLLGQPLPGGPHIDQLAREGNPREYKFGKVRTLGLTFSFSGIKSELVRIHQRAGGVLKIKDAAASYQSALLDHIFEKLEIAVEETKVRRIAFVGGVAANSELRRRADLWVSNGRLESVYFPSQKFCTDNAAMVGLLAYRKYLRAEVSALDADVIATSRPRKQRSVA